MILEKEDQLEDNKDSQCFQDIHGDELAHAYSLSDSKWPQSSFVEPLRIWPPEQSLESPRIMTIWTVVAAWVTTVFQHMFASSASYMVETHMLTAEMRQDMKMKRQGICS